MNVPRVLHDFLQRDILTATLEYTLVYRYVHINVHTVIKSSKLQLTVKYMKEYILELGHIPALFVVRVLLSQVA